jgi:hypothetical protein
MEIKGHGFGRSTVRRRTSDLLKTPSKKNPVDKADVRIIRRRAMVEELYGAPF